MHINYIYIPCFMHEMKFSGNWNSNEGGDGVFSSSSLKEKEMYQGCMYYMYMQIIKTICHMYCC